MSIGKMNKIDIAKENTTYINPTLDGGGHPVPPPVFFGSGAFQIDLRDPRLMDN